MKYVQKPVVIEAFQWLGSPDNIIQLTKWIPDDLVDMNEEGNLVLTTSEGEVTTWFGCMIIRGIKGEIYIRDKDLFDLTHEKLTYSHPRTFEGGNIEK